MRRISSAFAAAMLLIACSSGSDSPAGSDGSNADGSGNGSQSGNGQNGNGPNGGDGGGGTSSGDGDPVIAAGDVKVFNLELGSTLTSNEDEVGLAPVIVSPLPDGSARVAWMGKDGNVHIVKIDATGQLTGEATTLPAHDLSAFYADAAGGVVLLSRDATGGGTKNCGEPTNLCGTPPNPAVPCYDEYLVRFDGTSETWATKLTSSSAQLPPYSTSKTGARVYMIWWYAHHGRIAFDGSRYAAYFGDAISVSEGGCINIHQGDRMNVVDGTGALVSGGFELGCSHSGYERVIWDSRVSKFVAVCKTDNANRIAFAPNYGTIRDVDLAYSNFGDFVPDSGSGYWGTVSDIRAGQPANADGLAEVHLFHFATGKADKDEVVSTGQGLNERAPHIARYGKDHLLVAWEQSTKTGDLAPNDSGRQLFVQARTLADGSPVGSPLAIAGRSNRYDSLISYPDGSVGMLVAGTSATSVQLVRISPP